MVVFVVCLVCPVMVSVSLDCTFLIDPSVFSNDFLQLHMSWLFCVCEIVGGFCCCFFYFFYLFVVCVFFCFIFLLLQLMR
jgi:hypothetical protein